MTDAVGIAGADVGDHYGAGKQAHVPLEVLNVLGVEPGDRIVFAAYRDGGIRVEKDEPLQEDGEACR